MFSMLISVGYLPKQIRGSVCCLIANPHKQTLRLMFSFVIFPERTWQGLLRTHWCFLKNHLEAPQWYELLKSQSESEQIGRIAQFAQHFSQFRNQNSETNQATTLNSMLPVFQYHSGKPKQMKVTKKSQKTNSL